ncbi:hypothetical protein D6C85_05427 [Aureobasidium pullulans]|uniref:Uncharacterized protein n=1 Tax=Aureobasidium pullulans TaxID=5580 RepID=A0A4S9WZ30_AURPU|nr:hypothetical protein D6C85_05427 [Aureobasidium pullulans]
MPVRNRQSFFKGRVSAHGSVTQAFHDSDDSDDSARLVTKPHDLGQGAPWVVHERFVSGPYPLTPFLMLTFLKKTRGTTNTSAPRMRRSRKPIASHKPIVTTEYGPAQGHHFRLESRHAFGDFTNNIFETISKTTEGLTFKFPVTVTFPEHQSVNQLDKRRTEELYDQASGYLKNQRLVPKTKSRRVASRTSIPAPRTPAPPTTTTMAPRGLTNEEIEEDLVTMGLRLSTKKRKRSSAILL